MDNCVEDLVEQIAALESIEQTDEIVSILEELRKCQSALLEVERKSTEKQENENLIARTDDSDEDSDMNISDGEFSIPEHGLKLEDTHISISSRYKKVKKRRRVQPWLLMDDFILESDDINELLEIVNQYRDDGGLDSELVKSLWKLIHSKHLQIGNLIAFGLRCLNGSYKWYHGIVEEFSLEEETDDLHSLRVSFAAPQELNQLKCLHYDKGNCKFGVACKLSHGKWITPEIIRPLFWNGSEHLKEKRRVLFLPSGADFWIQGSIISINRDDKSQSDKIKSVVIRSNREEKDFIISNLSRILPYLKSDDFMGFLPGDTTVEIPEPQLREAVDDADKKQDDGDVSNGEGVVNTDIETELNSKNYPEWFGYWERHTKGFGSKMLIRMGYKMGGPLRPPSLKSTDPPPLIEPLPIRLLPPRVSLDYLTKQKRKGEAAGKILEFRRPGEEEIIEEEKRREELLQSTSMFGLVNRSDLTEGCIERQMREADHIRQAEELHQQNLQETRRGGRSDSSLRGELLHFERKLKILNDELRDAEKHLERHTGRGTVHTLQSIYAAAAAQRRIEIEKTKEEIKVIEERLSTNKSTKKLKIF